MMPLGLNIEIRLLINTDSRLWRAWLLWLESYIDISFSFSIKLHGEEFKVEVTVMC